MILIERMAMRPMRLLVQPMLRICGLKTSAIMPIIGERIESIDKLDKMVHDLNSDSILQFLAHTGDRAVTSNTICHKDEGKTGSNTSLQHELEKLLKLSGLPISLASNRKLQKRLHQQKLLLEKLQDAPPERAGENLDPYHARIAPRDAMAWDYDDLNSQIQNQVKDEELGELDSSWKPAELSHSHSGELYVLKRKIPPKD